MGKLEDYEKFLESKKILETKQQRKIKEISYSGFKNK
jgi:hypothetical protein